jgi:hypothetical protein
VEDMTASVLLGFLASSLCLWVQQTVPPQAAKPSPAASASPSISWHTAGEITIPFEFFKQHIYITASLNGKPGFVFMLDSGANRNILNLKTARALGLKERSLTEQNDIGFGNALIYVAPQENVEAAIDSVRVAHVMSVMDLNRFERHFSHETDGILGYPFLQQFVVKLDFERKLLTLMPARGYLYRGPGVPVALRPSKDFVMIPITVGTASFLFSKVNVAVDTGSNLTLMLYKPYVHALNLDYSLTRAQPTKGFGLNGYYPFALGNLDVLRIGDAEARNVPVAYLDRDEEPHAQRHIPGAIGNGILQSFQTIVFDVPQHRMFFELKPTQWQSGVVRTYVAPR